MLPSPRILILFLLLLLAALPAPAHAFSPHRILDDEDMVFKGQMTVADVQRFLEAHDSGLARYRAKDSRGVVRLAASLIVQAASDAQLNPQILLVLLQKEQGLVLSRAPSRIQLDWATGYGVCDACRLSDRGIQRYRGFVKQLRGAAKQLRHSLEEPQGLAIRRNSPTRIDEALVIPATNATAGLYLYTPHLNGNRIFWALWNRWFGRLVPQESLVRVAGEGRVWYIRGKTKSAITNAAVLVSRFKNLPILTVSTTELEKYQRAADLRHANFSVVRDNARNTYVLLDDLRRRIANEDVLRQLGYHPDEIDSISNTELALYQPGDVITLNDAYPVGALLRHPDGTVAYVLTSIRRRVAPELLSVLFPTTPIRDASIEEWERLTQGPDQRLSNGMLVKTPSDPRVYRIEGGERRWIPTEAIFTALGFPWDEVLTVPPQSVVLHPEALPIDAPTPDIPLQDDRFDRILKRSQ